MNKLEELSAFMDGESDVAVDSLLTSMRTDSELRGIWRRYHLVGDSLRGQLPEQLPATDLSSRISRALEGEPALLRPQRQPASVARRLLKPAAGMAIAASVAMVAIVGLRGLDHSGVVGGSATANRVATTAVNVADTVPSTSTVATPVQSLQPAAPSQLALTVSTDTDMAQGRGYRQSEQPAQSGGQYRFNSYLINHNEYRANSDVRGSMPYARIVAPYGGNQ